MKNKIKNLLIEALEKNFAKEAIKLVEVQQATAKHIKADYFSNIAMKLSKLLDEDPMEIAKDILKDIRENELCAYDIARPGYINFIIKDTKKNNIVLEILKNKNLIDSIKSKSPKKIHLEFVSANPTGPLHIGHGRGAIYGNIICLLYTSPSPRDRG